MLVKVSVVPPNKDYIILRQVNGLVGKFPRQLAMHVRAGDICRLVNTGKHPSLKLLTDEDDDVRIDNKQMILYKGN